MDLGAVKKEAGFGYRLSICGNRVGGYKRNPRIAGLSDSDSVVWLTEIRMGKWRRFVRREKFSFDHIFT